MKMDSSPIRAAVLPTHTIDTFRLPRDQAREIREYVVDGTFRLEDPPDHRARTQVWFLEGLLVASSAAEKSVLYRSQDLIDRNPTEVVKVRMYRSGRSLLVEGDRQEFIGTEAIHFIDQDRPLRQVSSDHEQVTLAVPYGLIGSLTDLLFVDRQIENIFTYRIKAVERIFGFEPVGVEVRGS